MRQYFDKLTRILKKYNITVLNGIFVGLMLVIACFAYNIMWQEKFMLDETDRKQKPAMLWSKTDFHEQILQTPDAVSKAGQKCMWPAWPAKIDKDDKNLNTLSCENSPAKSVASKVTVKPKNKLTHPTKAGDNPSLSLHYDDNAKILPDGEFTISVAFSGSQQQFSRSNIVLRSTAKGECVLTMQNGSVNSCELPGINKVRLQDGTDRSNMASIEIQNNEVFFYAENPKNWSYRGFSELTLPPQQILNCNATTNQFIPLQYKNLGIYVWCTTKSDNPKTEVERLATLVKKINKPDSLESPTVVSTFNLSVIGKLTEIVGSARDMKVTMMDAFTGEVRGLVSNITHSNDNNSVVIDNFKSESPGSIAKVIYSQAILSTIPELQSFIMKGFNGDSCRLLDVAIQTPATCKQANGYHADSHYTLATPLDFKNFIAHSENVYATSLLYLGSTIPLSESKCLNNTSQQRRVSTVVSDFNYGNQRSTIGGQPYNQWLNNRVGLFTEDIAEQCDTDKKMPLWYDYMIAHMNIYDPKDTRNHYRSYIWGWGSPLSNLDEMQHISPERELSSFNLNSLNKLFTAEAYKAVYSGGGYNWSNLSVAESVSAIVSKKHIKATVVKAVPNSSFDSLEVNAANIVLDGMKLVISATGGTANALCHQARLTCQNNFATFTHPRFGNLVVLAKTGTPKRVQSTGLRTGKGLWQTFEKILKDDGKVLDDDWCSDNEVTLLGSHASGKQEEICLLAAPAHDVLIRIQQRINADSRKKSHWTSQYIEGEFRRWLTAQLNKSTTIAESASDAPPPNYEEVDEDVKRLVLVIAQPLQPNSFATNDYKHACTFMISTQNSTGHLLFATRLIESIRRDNDDTLLKKCSFENRESSVEAIR